MNLKAYLFDDSRGVSPVIGVILMVAITVILAAVIATFVMNMGPNENTVPNAQFEFEEDSSGTGDFIVAHDGGQAVPHSEITLSSSSAGSLAGSGDYTAGDPVVNSLTAGTGTVEIIWENPNSDETQVIFSEDVPS